MSTSNNEAAPTISIIIPLYNVEHYVVECLDSLRQQDFGDFEALVIDDGSQDNSLQVAKAAVAGDARFRFFACEHAGQSAARNVGIDHARGEFVMFLDSDDYHVPGSLRRLMQVIRAYDLDLLYFTADTLYEDEYVAHLLNEDDMMHRDSCLAPMPGPELFVWFEERRQLWVSGPLQIVKRQLLEDHHIRLLEGVIHEDELYTTQLLTYAHRAWFLNEPLYMRRVHAGSTMTRKRGLRNIQAVWRITDLMDDWIRTHGSEYSPRFVDMYARHIFDLRDTMGRDSIFVPDAELDAFAAGLAPEKRALFNLYVRDNGVNIDAHYREMKQTRSFRAGHILNRLLGSPWAE